MTQENEKVRKQMQTICIDDFVPQNHLLRIIDKAIDRKFICELVEDKYSPDMGSPSLDPVTLIKIPLIQYLYGIKSMFGKTITLSWLVPQINKNSKIVACDKMVVTHENPGLLY